MKSISVTLYRNQLIFDVDSVAFITGEVLPTDDAVLRSGIQDVAREDCRLDRLNIILNKSFGELTHSLTAYTQLPLTGDVGITNIYEDTDSAIFNLNPASYDTLTIREYSGDFVITLYVGDTFSAPSVPAVKNAMHAYIVSKALAEWFSITKKDEVQMYEDKATREILNLHSFLRARVTAVRRPLSVF